MQAVRKVFYDEGYDHIRYTTGGWLSKTAYFIIYIIALPFMSLGYIAAKRLCCLCSCFNFCENTNQDENVLEMEEANELRPEKVSQRRRKRGCLESLVHFMEIPVNRLLNNLASYLAFISLVALAEVNPSDKPGTVSISWYHIAVSIFALGNLTTDVFGLWRRSRAARARGLSAAASFSRALGTYTRICRLTGHILLLTGMSVEASGYLAEKQATARGGGMRSPAEAHCPIDDPRTYFEYHPVKIGISLQGVGFALIVIHSLHFFR